MANDDREFERDERSRREQEARERERSQRDSNQAVDGQDWVDRFRGEITPGETDIAAFEGEGEDAARTSQAPRGETWGAEDAMESERGWQSEDRRDNLDLPQEGEQDWEHTRGGEFHYYEERAPRSGERDPRQGYRRPTGRERGTGPVDRGGPVLDRVPQPREDARGYEMRPGNRPGRARGWRGGAFAERDESQPERRSGFEQAARGRQLADWQQVGPYTGRGPRGYHRSDERIREDAIERLTRHGQVDPSDFEVEVSGGELTLRGSVRDRREKRMAEDAVANIAGVRDVHNELRLRG